MTVPASREPNARTVALDVRRELASVLEENVRLRQHIDELEQGVKKGEERRRAMLHILQDSHRQNMRLADSRKAMIHIMGDLRETTEAIQRSEQDLRDKQEQLVQAGKLATLGELTTGVAHELNNPLNNIGLFIGNVLDRLETGAFQVEELRADLEKALEQVHKATEIITHLRTFGRVALVTREPVDVNGVLRSALSLMSEQLRQRQIDVTLALAPEDPATLGNPIQLEQVFINLLANARDAVASARTKRIEVTSRLAGDTIVITFQDSGPGVPSGLDRRIFDPFFTTKDVGQGTGLGLSITYGIIKEHEGDITVANTPGSGACFSITIPIARDLQETEPV